MFDAEECCNYYKTHLAVHFLGYHFRPFVMTKLDNFINGIRSGGRSLSIQDWNYELKQIARDPQILKGISKIPTCGEDVAGLYASKRGTAVDKMDSSAVFKILKNCHLFTDSNRDDVVDAIQKVVDLRNDFSHISTKYLHPKLSNPDLARRFDEMKKLLETMRSFGMEKTEEVIGKLSEIKDASRMQDAVYVVQYTFGEVDYVDLPEKHSGGFNTIIEEWMEKYRSKGNKWEKTLATPPTQSQTEALSQHGQTSSQHGQTLSQHGQRLSQVEQRLSQVEQLTDRVDVLDKQQKEGRERTEELLTLASYIVRNESVDASAPSCSHTVMNNKECKALDDPELMDIAGEIGTEWREVGTYLGMSKQTLDQLWMNDPANAKQRCFHMFQSWKQGQSLETDIRDKLAQNLRRAKLVSLADKVEKGYGGHEEYGKTKQPVTCAGDAPFSSPKDAPAIKSSLSKMSTQSRGSDTPQASSPSFVSAKTKVANMTVRQVKTFLTEHKIGFKGVLEKKDLQDLAIEEMERVEKGRDDLHYTNQNESTTTQQASIPAEDIPSTSAVSSNGDHKPSTSTDGQGSQMSTDTIRNEVLQLSVKELKVILDANNTDYKRIIEKSELQNLVIKIKQGEGVLSSITNQKLPTETKNNVRKRKASKEDEPKPSLTAGKAKKMKVAGKPKGRPKAIQNIKKEEEGVTWYLHAKISSLQKPFKCTNDSLKMQMVLDDDTDKIDAIGFFEDHDEFHELYDTLKRKNWYWFKKVNVTLLKKQFKRVANHKYEISITPGIYIKPAPSPASS